MKKIFSVLISFALIFLLSFNTLATDETVTTTKYSSLEYFEDGSYIEIEIIEGFSPASAKETRSAKLGSKKLTYKNSDGDVQWTATLSGTFTYDGSTCTCTSTGITYSIEDNSWKIPSATSSKSGNKAIGNVTAKYYFWGIPTKTVNEVITLTCSATGVLS